MPGSDSNPDFPAMAFDDFLGDGKPYAGALVSAAFMKALEDYEYSIEKFRINTDSIIPDRKNPLGIILFCRNFSPPAF